MSVLVMQLIGVVVFLGGTIVLRRRSGKSRDPVAVGKLIRVSHGLFWVALVLPAAVGFFHPGFERYDAALGLRGLPYRSLWFAVGVVSMTMGIGLMALSNRSLVKTGRGAASFALTERLVTDGIYGRTRNPMSLGLYLAAVGTGLLAGSLAATLGALLVVVPAHVFNLRHFEEHELGIRYGDSYREYKKRVPFLLPRFRRE